jgi:hypothetical protein
MRRNRQEYNRGGKGNEKEEKEEKYRLPAVEAAATAQFKSPR